MDFAAVTIGAGDIPASKLPLNAAVLGPGPWPWTRHERHQG